MFMQVFTFESFPRNQGYDCLGLFDPKAHVQVIVLFWFKVF